MGLPANAIDIHVHAGPSVFERTHGAIELAEALAGRNMGAVYKSHFSNTYTAVEIARSAVPDVEIYSSITLNEFIGGCNDAAVRHAIETGAKVVWLPTLDAANFDVSTMGRQYPFTSRNLTVTTDEDDSTVTDEIRSVLTTIADADRRVVLGNGHISRKETFAVLDTIEELGLSVPYLVTHADFEFMGLSIEDQFALADRGAILEKCYLPVVHGDLSIGEFAASIRRLGLDHCVLSTDHGAVGADGPPDAYASLLEALGEQGFSDADLGRLAVENPRRLLGVDHRD